MSTEIKHTMALDEVVMKLVGKITPIGKSEVDEERLENLKMLCDLVDKLVTKIDEVGYDNKDRYEASMRRAGEFAYNFITKTLGINQ